MSTSWCDHCATRPASQENLCLTCVKKVGPTPVIKGFEWMTEEEQVHHLIETHGYNEDWFHEDDEDWDRARVEEFFADSEERWSFHSTDHAEHPEGGSEQNRHKHALVHPAEVNAAIASIKEVLTRV